MAKKRKRLKKNALARHKFKISRAKAMKAWHFAERGGILKKYHYKKTFFVNGREATAIAIKTGSTYMVKGKVQLCTNGLHSSIRLLDAARFKNSDHISRVLVWGDIHEAHDKICTRYRKVVWNMCARKFAREFTFRLLMQFFRTKKLSKRTRKYLHDAIKGDNKIAWAVPKRTMYGSDYSAVHCADNIKRESCGFRLLGRVCEELRRHIEIHQKSVKEADKFIKEIDKKLEQELEAEFKARAKKAA